MSQLLNGPGIQREEFGANQIEVIKETAATAVAAQAKAAVEARYILALRKPREWEEVRVRMEKECRRPGFAQVARYAKPVGNQKIVGPSIRFAEAALRCMTNVYPETTIIYESAEQRIVQVSVTDLESNLTYSSQVVLSKTVERSKPTGVVVGERLNSRGEKVYIVQATEDELLNKQNALISKALRTSALRLLPGDILDRCMDLVIETLSGEVKNDPDAEKRKIVDAFSGIGVSPSDITAYLGHTLDRIQPAELVDLRQVFTAIREGEATWESIMDTAQKGSTEEAQRVAAEKIARLNREKVEREAKSQATTGEQKVATDQPLSDEENRKLDQQAAAEERASQSGPTNTSGFAFGSRRARQ